MQLGKISETILDSEFVAEFLYLRFEIFELGAAFQVFTGLCKFMSSSIEPIKRQIC